MKVGEAGGAGAARVRWDLEIVEGVRLRVWVLFVNRNGKHCDTLESGRNDRFGLQILWPIWDIKSKQPYGKLPHSKDGAQRRLHH